MKPMVRNATPTIANVTGTAAKAAGMKAGGGHLTMWIHNNYPEADESDFAAVRGLAQLEG